MRPCPAGVFPPSNRASRRMLELRARPGAELRRAMLLYGRPFLATLALAVKQQRVGLMDRGHSDARDIHMRRTACRPHNGVGNVLGRQRRQSLVNLGGALLVAVEAHQAEIGL